MSSTTPQRRVPLPLSNVPLPEDTDNVAVEIDSLCREEQKNYTVMGSLTPRRIRAASSVEGEGENEVANYDAWKLRVFQPRRPGETQSSSCVTATSPIPSPPAVDTYKGKKLYFQLQRLFEVISATGEPCADRPALFAFSLACSERNPMIRWVPETNLSRTILQRQQQLSSAHQEQRDRAEKLLVEQRPVLSERQRLDAQWAASRDEASLGALADSNLLQDIQRKAAQEEERRDREEREKKRLGEERLAIAREAAQRRKQERDRKLQELLDKDEETRLDMEAVDRVRAQLEAERNKSATMHTIQAATTTSSR